MRVPLKKTHGAPKEIDMVNGHELGEWMPDGFYGRFAEIVDWNPNGTPKICQVRAKFDKDGSYISHCFTAWEDAIEKIAAQNKQ